MVQKRMWIFICVVMLGSCCHAASSDAKNGTTTTTTTTTVPKSLKLLAISGYVDDESVTSVEKIDPTNINSLCDNVPDYPVKMSIGTAQNFGNKFIVSCGDYAQTNRMCYRYTPTNGWEEYVQLAEYRQWTASALTYNGNMWVLGGNNGHRLRTTEIINVKTKSVRSGPDLPEAMDIHCAVNINATHVFIGNVWKMTAYIVNVSEEPFEFTRLPDMKHYRSTGGCGFIMMKNGEESGKSSEGNGEPAVIVAGGGFGTLVERTTSEIFLVEKNQWVEGPALPRGFYNGGSVNPDPHTFILAGGFDEDNNPHSDIFQLDVETMKFVTMPGKLKKPWSSFAMTWMMDDDQC